MGILITLMDEVFDLKQRNQWLRRQIVAALQQMIRAFIGDRMNKKIYDYINHAILPDQVSFLFSANLLPSMCNYLRFYNLLV